MRILFFEIFADTGQRPAGTDPRDKNIDIAAGLLPDFRPGGTFMNSGIGGIVKLPQSDRSFYLTVESLPMAPVIPFAPSVSTSSAP